MQRTIVHMLMDLDAFAKEVVILSSDSLENVIEPLLAIIQKCCLVIDQLVDVFRYLPCWNT